MLSKTPLKYIGLAIAVAGAIVWNRALTISFFWLAFW